MNLSNIFESTDFVHASGTKEELQVAEFLKATVRGAGSASEAGGFSGCYGRD